MNQLIVQNAIHALVRYALRAELIAERDLWWATNALLGALRLTAYEGPEPGEAAGDAPLEEILRVLLDDAVARGVIEDGTASRDLFDTQLMGLLTPRPEAVIAEFERRYANSPEDATDWYYAFSQKTDYIRSYRTAKDVRYVTATPYGDLDITINLAKPEKDPRAIAAAKNAPQGGYPKCPLCRENEGYAGHLGHPARQNHRIIPLELAGERWYLQYSPYVYYNEHCIALNEQHSPMKINRAALDRMLDFVRQFPHYFIGSNADLPIVGGSILSHDHFQGGRYEFAMARAPMEQRWAFEGHEGIAAGTVKWPMTVLRLRGADPARLGDLAEYVLAAWRAYSDPAADVLAETDGVPHNTITPIARRRGTDYELDLVLRNNRTTAERPYGLFHPREELHHIKKENIGLIEVMGLAVLPARLVGELAAVEQALRIGADLRADERTAAHAAWAAGVAARHDLEGDLTQALQGEVGLVFMQVLEDAGVYKRDAAGQAAFARFLRSCGGRTLDKN